MSQLNLTHIHCFNPINLYILIWCSSIIHQKISIPFWDIMSPFKAEYVISGCISFTAEEILLDLQICQLSSHALIYPSLGSLLLLWGVSLDISLANSIYNPPPPPALVILWWFPPILIPSYVILSDSVCFVLFHLVRWNIPWPHFLPRSCSCPIRFLLCCHVWYSGISTWAVHSLIYPHPVPLIVAYFRIYL